MDSLQANPFVSSGLDQSYLIENQYTSQQASELHEDQLALKSAWDIQSMGGSAVADEAYLVRLVDPYSALQNQNTRNLESFGNTQPPLTGSMALFTHSRKRKCPTLRSIDWEPHKARIIELHNMNRLSLQEVKERIEKEHGFSASLRQYRTRISQWNIDKNIKPKEMKAIVRKQQQRKLVETDKGELVLKVRGFEVNQKKIDRWMNRNQVPESLLYVPSPVASTPSAVSYRTVSEQGSPAPNCENSVGIPDFLQTAGSVSVIHSPLIFSPGPSISSIIRPQGSIFARQSPVSIYQSHKSFDSDFLLSDDSQDQFALIPLNLSENIQPSEVGTTTVDPGRYRYRKMEEENLQKKLC